MNLNQLIIHRMYYSILSLLLICPFVGLPSVRSLCRLLLLGSVGECARQISVHYRVWGHYTQNHYSTYVIRTDAPSPLQNQAFLVSRDVQTKEIAFDANTTHFNQFRKKCKGCTGSVDLQGSLIEEKIYRSPVMSIE